MAMDCPTCAAPIDKGADVCPACGRSLSALPLGSVLASRYDLRALLGEGGMGLVYRAFDRKLEEEVAIKIFRTDLPSNAVAARRFRTEIERARAVSDQNVCRIHDHGEAGPLGYIAMEILPGQDLRKTLKGQPRGLPEAEALSAVLQIASGLQAIHDAGILHGDLKTADAVRDERGLVRIVPFGLVKDWLSPTQTGAGEFSGASEYMSPEHCRGYALDLRSDIYGLGIVAFELFAGEVPFRGENVMDTLFKQMLEAPLFDSEPGSRVPRKFVPALRRALAKAAADRFASAQEFAQALRSEAPEAPAVAPPGPAPQIKAAEIPGPVPIVAPPGPPPQTSAAASTAPPPQIPAAETPAPAKEDARRDERYTLPTDVRLRKLGPGGVLEKEERTIAHDLSRSGMRLLTSWSDLEEGDQVSIEEVGGNFSTGAIVRHVNRGSDQITRVGIEFLERKAPDRLVGTTTSIARPVYSSVQSSVGSPGGGSGPIPPSPGSGSISPPGSSRSISRPRTTGSISRPRTTGSTSRPKTTGSTSRPKNTTSIPRPHITSTIPPHVGGNPSSGAPAAPPRSPESVLEEIAKALATARGLIGESKIWEALECFGKAQALAEGTPEASAIRILTWETQAKVPSLMRAAQQNLEDFARNEPLNVAAHSALGRIFWQAGLAARARVAFNRVLALDPSNREATAALGVLNDPTKRR